MTRPAIADHPARLAAQRVFDRPLALEAGAGTGKTTALVARVVAWCLGPGWTAAAADGLEDHEIAERVLDGVVAITFTEDAAAEMAARVADAFMHIAHLGPTRSQLEIFEGLARDSLPDDLGLAADRARRMVVRLDRLRISTIHAFARSLISRFPVEAGLHPAFQMDADGSMVDELVEFAVEDHLPRAYERGDRDALLLADVGVGPRDIRDTARFLVSECVSAEKLTKDPFDGPGPGALLTRLTKALKACRPDLEALAATSEDVRHAADELLMIASILDRALPPLEKLTAIQALEIPGGKGRSYTLTKTRHWTEGNFPTRGRPDNLSDDRLGSAAHHIDTILRHIDTLDPEAFNALRRLLHPIVSQVEEAKRRRGVLVFQDLLSTACRLLAEHTSVRRQLQQEIAQLLVDEMQDTDEEQAEIVRRLALDEHAEVQPCLFLVGDPKQSIYGWRRADMAVYEDLVQRIVQRGGERHSLVVNFRSTPAVLDEVTRIVAPSMIEKPGLQPPFQRLHPGPKLAGEPEIHDGRRRPVEHWVSDPASTLSADGKPGTAEIAALEAESVAADIADLVAHGHDPCEMAILMRSRSHLPTYLDALRRHGVAYAVARDKTFYQSREVTELLGFTCLVLDPFDTLALATTLRSALVGVPDHALAPLWRAGLPGLFRSQPHDPAAIERVVVDATEEVAELGLGDLGLPLWPHAVRRLAATVATLRDSFALEPPDVFVEKLRELTCAEPRAAGRFPGAYRLANVEQFCDRLLADLLDGADAAAILTRLRRASRDRPAEETGRPPGAQTGAVQVMTIHGAKGLGFEHVWLVQTHAKGITREETNQAGAVDGHLELRLHGFPSPNMDRVTAHRKQVDKEETVRLLYVALTRAKRRLVTVGARNARKPMSLLQLLTRRVLADGTPAWPDRVAELNVPEDAPWADRDEARWVVLSHPVWAVGLQARAIAAKEPAPVNPDQYAAEAEALQELRARAAEHQSRPWTSPASAEAHRTLDATLAPPVDDNEGEGHRHPPGAIGTPREVATAVGSALHRMLELFDLTSDDPDAELEARRQAECARLDTVLTNENDVKTAEQRLLRITHAFRNGPLWPRFLTILPHIAARELPVILPPSNASAAVGAVSGFIDLVYRDPDTAELVVADYKSDEADHITERAAAYAHQGEVYCQALCDALELRSPPRFELWFLAASTIVQP